MSGYRNLHREQIESTAIWNVATSPLLMASRRGAANAYRVWTASADGLVRGYKAMEKTMEEKQQNDSKSLDASALSMTCTHVLLGTNQTSYSTTESPSATALGASQVSVGRNYVGDDDAAGDLVLASLELSGVVRIWVLAENEDAEESTNKQVVAQQEFSVDNATGTVLMLCPPKNWGSTDLMVAVGCLDGTVAIVATGILTPQRVDSNGKATKEPTQAGTVVDRLGSRGSAIPLSIASHPFAPVVAVGRRDGQIDILTSSNSSHHDNSQQHRRHRLRLPGFQTNGQGSPIRALAYTPDGALLAAGNDGGMLAVWDVSRRSTTAAPALVHHIVSAHASWILDVVSLRDSRRFLTCGADQKMHVWRLDQMYQPVHTFDSDQTVWTLAIREESADNNNNNKSNKPIARCACGTETGWLQILSLDGK